MQRNEPGITQLLHDHLGDAARGKGIKFQAFPLGPQDRNVLADSLFASKDLFALIEMKFSAAQLRSERAKRGRVLKLCEGLEVDAPMRDLHERCHHIAWSDGSGISLACYRDRICNRLILGEDCGLPSAAPGVEARNFFGDYTDGFLSNSQSSGLPKGDFKRYLRWLQEKTTGKASERLEVLAKGPGQNGDVVVLSLNSLDEIQAWFESPPRPLTAPSRPRR